MSVPELIGRSALPAAFSRPGPEPRSRWCLAARHQSTTGPIGLRSRSLARRLGTGFASCDRPDAESWYAVPLPRLRPLAGPRSFHALAVYIRQTRPAEYVPEGAAVSDVPVVGPGRAMYQ